MATCGYCAKDMLSTESCEPHVLVYADGEEFDPIPYGGETRFADEPGWEYTPTGRCHDCGTMPGHIHHPGCDVAECPRCGRQLLLHEPPVLKHYPAMTVGDCVTLEAIDIDGERLELFTNGGG